MEKYLLKPTEVTLDDLYLDPNNPRLAREDKPGYDDPDALFDDELQPELEESVHAAYDVPDLIAAIEAQGWMPFDAIVVWEHPKAKGKYIVVEGNTRTVALRDLHRNRLPKEEKKLQSMKSGRKGLAAHQIELQEQLVARLKEIVRDTKKIEVRPLNAKTVDELKQKLPRVLSVRHIQGAKAWGNYAEDLWILDRYASLFSVKFPKEKFRWEQSLINTVADEASLSSTTARRKLQAASAFSDFKANWEDQLPEEEAFIKGDYYLFECITKKPWLREQFNFGHDKLVIPMDRAKTLFEWCFKLPRGRTKEDNPNKFYRHENVLEWEKMRRYDDENRTTFSQRFDVDNPATAPRFAEVEAQWLAHKEGRAPTELLESLITQLKEIKQDTLVSQGDFLEPKLQTLIERAKQCLAMIEVARKATTDKDDDDNGAEKTATVPAKSRTSTKR